MKKRREILETAVWTRARISRMIRTFPARGVHLPERAEVAADPLVDVWERPEEIVVEVELPGMGREDFDLTLDEGSLIIEGYKRKSRVPGCLGFHRLEREFGYFRRNLELPAGVHNARIKASFRDGLLTIVFPKQENRRKGLVKITVTD